MANDTRSSQKSNDDENNDLKGRHISTRGSTSSGATTPETSGLRKSSRVMPMKKNMIPSPPSTRKSERLEKRTTTPPRVTRKPERVEKRNMLSPLRCSEKGKKLSSSSSSGMEKSDRTSGSSNIKQKKEKKEKSVKQLAMEAKEVNKSEKQDEKPVRVGKKRMDGRAYSALFKRPKMVNASDHPEELNMMDKLSQVCSSSCRGSGSKKVDVGIESSDMRGEEKYVEIACETTLEGSTSGGSESAEEMLENNVGAELLHSTHSIQKHSCTKEANCPENGESMEVSKNGAIDDEKTLVDCSAQKNRQTPQLVDTETGLERGDIVMLSKRKRKRNTVDKDSDAYAMLASEDIRTLIADAITSSPSGSKSKNHPEACSTCFKRPRVDYYTTKQEGCSCKAKSNLKFCDMSLNNDRGELEAGVITGLGEHPNDYMQQNVSSIDCQKDGDFVCKLGGKLLDSADPPSLKSRLQEGTVVGERDKGGTLGSFAHAASRSLPTSTSCLNDTMHGNHGSTLNHSANNISEVLGVMLDESDGRRKLRESQKYLYVLLKPEIAKLCELLHLSEDVKGMVEKFLEYVMNNHLVNREPATILQAFQISLCWTAASLVKHKIDHKESLALAKEHLKFGCKKDEAYYVYSMLRCLKKMFLCRTGNLKLAFSPKASEQSTKAVGKDHPDARLSHATFGKMVDVEVKDQSQGQECSTKLTLPESGLTLDFQLAQKDISKSIKEIQKKCHKQMKKLLQKQKEEKEDFDRKYEEEKAQLENKNKRVAGFIHLLSDYQIRTDKLKKLDSEYAKKFEELKLKMDIRFKNLEAMQVAARNKLLDKEALWVEGVRSWAHDELINPPLNKPSLPEVQCPDKLVDTTPSSGMRSSETCTNAPDVVVACSDPFDRVTPLVRTNGENAKLDNMAAEGASDTGFKECNVAASSGDGQQNAISVDPSSKEQTTVGAISDGETQTDVSEIVTSNDHPQDALQVTCSSPQQICDGTTLSIPNGDISLAASGTVSSGDGLENVLSVEAPPSVEKIPEVSTLRNGEIPLRAPETESFAEGQENIVSVNSPLYEDQIPEGATSLFSDGDVSLRVPEIAGSNVTLENVASASPSSTGEQFPTLATLCMPEGEVPEEVPGAARSEVERGGNTGRKNEGASTVASDNAIRVGQQDGEICAVSQDIHFQDLSLIGTSLVQPVSTTGQGCSMPSDQALQDACSLPSTSAGIQVGDAATIEMQNISQQVEPPLSHPVDSVASDHSNHEAEVIETVVQMQLLPPRDPPSNHDLPAASGYVHLPSSDGIIVNQISQASGQLMENHIELPNQAVLQPPASTAVHLPTDTPIGGVATHVSDTTPCSSSHPVQTAIPAVSRMPRPLYNDPLQNEMDRIFKEIDQIIKIHEETKVRFRSNCEKEIEEVIAQIRRNYEVKLRDIEAEFFLKKKELDLNHNKVLMNKILAEAFRSKCMDNRTSGLPGMQQEMTSSFMQQLVQLSSQHPTQRPSIVTDLASAGPTTANLQTAAAPVGSLHTASSHSVSPPATVPLLQAVHYPSARASGTPTRPLPPTGSPRLGSEIRAPAPHLQRFRLSTSMSASSLPALSRGISSTSNPTATSPSLQQHPTRISPSIYQSATYNRAHRPETAGGLPAHPNSSLSALELLLNVANLASTNPNPPSSLPQPSDSGANLDPLGQSQSALLNSIQASPVQTNGTTDIVCLSDDD